MKLLLVRQKTTPNFTEGDLYVNETWFSFTLEDTVRPKGSKKVYGQTAIPAGTYKVVVDYSEKFKKRMVHILNVPGFEGIRIHQGLTALDSLGCLLISKRRGGSPGVLAAMRAGVLTNELTAMVEAAGGCEIEVRDAAA